MKILILLAFLSTSIYALDSLKCNEIYSLMDEEKWEEVKTEIDAVKDLDDPDYYFLLENYYFRKAKNSKLAISSDPPMEEEAVAIIDSAGQTYYMTETTSHDMEVINEGLPIFKPALAKFPSRLDIKVRYALGVYNCGLYSEMEFAMKDILQTSKAINNSWLGNYNMPFTESEELMLNQMQAFIYRLLDLELEGADSIVFRISEQMAELYPESVFGYNNMGIVYARRQNYDKALISYLKALKTDPNDVLVMGNLVDTYLTLENYDTAIYYLNRIVETGDESYGPWAKEILDELENAIEEEEVY